MYDIQFLYQKSGYLFEKYQKDLGIKDGPINNCLVKVGNGIRYFEEDARDGKGLLMKKWNLIVPKGFEINSFSGTLFP